VLYPGITNLVDIASFGARARDAPCFIVCGMEQNTSNVITFPAQPTDEDLDLFEESCRRLARRYREDAWRSLPGFREYKLREAAEWERIAESVERERLGE
jgi:hypothetical protein